MGKEKCKCITYIVFASLAIIIGLIAGSFEVVPLLHYGILIDSAKITLKDKENYLYLSGRYHAGLGNDFTKLPSKRITLALSDDDTIKKSSEYSEDSIITRTIEGIPLRTTVSCQIKLLNTEIIESENETAKKEYNVLYLNTIRKLNLFDDNNYKKILATIMKSTLLDVISTYKLNEVYSKR